MITLELVRRMWQLIELPKSAENVEARQVDLITVQCGHPFLTIDLRNQRHLLIPVDRNDKMIEDKQSAGIHILVNEWGDLERKATYIDIVCLKPYLNDLFDMIVFEILLAIDGIDDRIDKICQVILVRWRDLLGREPSMLPERSILVGLFGELSILEMVIRHNPMALDIWVGPNGGRYDFFSGSIALEVKTSIRGKGRIITIHSHDQLEIPQSGSLYLCCFKLEERPSGGISINDIVNNLIALGCDRMRLFTKLANIGLFANTISQCNEIRFSILERRTYHVNESFPRITCESFKSNTLPNHVISLSYQLDLSSEPPHALKEAQELDLISNISRMGL